MCCVSVQGECFLLFVCEQLVYVRMCVFVCPFAIADVRGCVVCVYVYELACLLCICDLMCVCIYAFIYHVSLCSCALKLSP